MCILDLFLCYFHWVLEGVTCIVNPVGYKIINDYTYITTFRSIFTSNIKFIGTETKNLQKRPYIK